MQVEISTIAGWALCGWDLDPFGSLRIELRRIDFDTSLARDYRNGEVLFRALTSLNIALAPKREMLLPVEAVRTSKNSNDEDVIDLDLGSSGKIDLTAEEFIAFVY
jgi:hypothetical protein